MSSKLLARREERRISRSHLRPHIGDKIIFCDRFAMSIATFIKQDLIANIRSGEIGSDRLTLDALSKRYRVSATPVRVAVRELIEEKYLKKGDNGRLVDSF